jgi:hypothetical protein
MHELFGVEPLRKELECSFCTEVLTNYRIGQFIRGTHQFQGKFLPVLKP